jgi:STE24 endopeptidase
VPADNVYTDDASRQSRRLNGHVSGAFGAARVIIDDTALTSAPETVKALAAHEMGHDVMHHPSKMVLIGTLVAIFGFAIIACLEPLLIRRVGLRWGISDATQTGTIAVFWLLFTGWAFVSDPLTNAYARVQETQADDFSLALAREPTGLADLMIQDADIGPLQPTTSDLILFYDHPSDATRVRAAMQWRAEHRSTK